jgi:SNF2 family DNA or RNA helicase
MSNWPTSLPSISGSPQLPEEVKASQASSKGRPAAGTLVVCPTSVLRQWAQEIRDKVTAEAKVSVLVYHGSSRTRDPQELAKYDVVLSTYSIVSMEVPKQPLPEEKDEDKRNPNDYGFVPFSKPKKEKPEKVKKAKGKGRGMAVDGDTSISVDSGPLARVAWFRVVLDEAQSIKNYRTQVARAAWGLRAKRRWCLSGTPIQNSVDDLFSYFRFLRYFPWDTYKKFQYDIKDPVSRNPSEGYRKLQAILKPIVLRRTKTCLIDGKPIVNLPPRIVKLQQAEFSLDERTFYTNLEAESRAQFQEYAAAGTVQSNYVNILWMLLRLRQACDHPMLVKKCSKAAAGQKTSVESARKLPPPQRLELIQCLEGSRTLCNICQDAPEDPVVSICSHVFCRQCISEQMANGDDTTCRYPKCKRALNSTLLYSLAALKDLGLGNGCSATDTDTDPSVAIAAKGEEITWRTSSKIDAVINTLQALPMISYLVEDGKVVKGPKAEKFLEAETMRFEQTKIEQIKFEQTVFDQNKLETKFEQTSIEQTGAECTALTVTSEAAGSLIEKVESTEKAIVFSQWTSMLDLLETPLKNAGFCYRRLDGTMSVLARDKAVSDFNTRPEVTVMIMSLKAASLGLNMVAACHVLLLDVWWNPTTEDQAIDRAHRIGQTRTVNVSRFTVKNTIEDRILELQERKRQIVASAFGENEGGEQKTRLTVEDLRYLFRV